jgi:hypothetical protein
MNLSQSSIDLLYRKQALAFCLSQFANSFATKTDASPYLSIVSSFAFPGVAVIGDRRLHGSHLALSVVLVFVTGSQRDRGFYLAGFATAHGETEDQITLYCPGNHLNLGASDAMGLISSLRFPDVSRSGDAELCDILPTLS